MKGYLLTREQIDGLEGVEKTHFLNDNAQRLNKSLGDLTGLTKLGFHIIEVPPGRESTELHMHHHEDECLFVLEGEATATIGDSTYAVRAGDFVGYRAGGEPHKLENTGAETLRCIVAGLRLDHDVADYPRRRKRLFRNRGLKWNLVDVDEVDEPEAGRKV